ncbi:hypothetical protein DY000_02007122 [Brassica cretica]|uniref:Uncharacterized protein n=1 Tax=Brassica cretica TaxID=69181 RepID=A0ABQ7CHJ9_BRACR|nr:hypothetical protein DY000_02007122 [Brassica cretica]
MEGSPYRKFSISRGKGAILGPDPENSIAGNRGSYQRGSWEPVFLPAWILGTGVPSGVDPEAGVQPGVWKNSIPKYFSQTLYIVSLRRALVGWSSLNSSIFRNMEGSPYRKLSFSLGKGAVPGTRPEVLHSGEPGYLLAGIQRPVFCLGSGGIQYLSHRSSNPAIPVPLRPEPHSEPGGGPVPSLQTGGWRY